jgi:lipoyl-dependent peroxiredoxin
MGGFMNVLYTATALATGDGRNGHASSDDGILDLDMRMPKEMGGAGGAANPEMLFALGYAACFHSALKLVAGQGKLNVTGSEVSASVGIGPLDGGGFGLTVGLQVHAPNLDRPTAEALVARAHEVCPYSNATRGNIPVSLSVV